MKTAVRIAQALVGILFIVSGLVKANDPIGLGYKMQEFFELWSAGFAQGNFVRKALDFFNGVALPLSVAMITLEISAGVALLLGWRKKSILWLLLLLIIFFTFLTGYAFLSGKFTNCGCFGDCLPITPLASFVKDIVLLVLVLFLLAGQKYITPLFTPTLRLAVLLVSLVFSFGLQWYVLHYLPLADCLPFKKGNNVAAQMKPPPGSKPDSIVMKFVYEKEGKRYEWAANELPADFSTYKYVDRIDKIVRKGNAEAAIKGFSLAGLSGADSTQIVLGQPVAVLAFALDVQNEPWLSSFKTLTEAARQKGLTVYFASTNATQAAALFAKAGISNTQFFAVDFTVVRTVARTSPTILFVKSGTVAKKWSKQEIGKAAEAVRTQSF